MKDGKSSIEKQSKRILAVLDVARSPVTLRYLSLHTGIEDPLEILEEMERNGLVRRCPSSTWSCSLGPMYELQNSRLLRNVYKQC